MIAGKTRERYETRDQNPNQSPPGLFCSKQDPGLFCSKQDPECSGYPIWQSDLGFWNASGRGYLLSNQVRLE